MFSTIIFESLSDVWRKCFNFERCTGFGTAFNLSGVVSMVRMMGAVKYFGEMIQVEHVLKKGGSSTS